MPFSRTVAGSEMQTATSRVWTHITNSISYNFHITELPVLKIKNKTMIFIVLLYSNIYLYLRLLTLVAVEYM